mmetsp:Transcript_23476/g.67653  ORF Transcript_23476/g.67653 Transcript_23476/m.67653 type:complete len:224 (+) Transcript_23476:2235-2906(+)
MRGKVEDRHPLPLGGRGGLGPGRVRTPTGGVDRCRRGRYVPASAGVEKDGHLRTMDLLHDNTGSNSGHSIIAVGIGRGGHQPRPAGLLPFPQQFGPFGIGQLFPLFSSPLAVPPPHQHVHHKGDENRLDHHMDGILSDQCDPPRTVLLGQGKEQMGQGAVVTALAEVGHRRRGGTTGRGIADRKEPEWRRRHRIDERLVRIVAVPSRQVAEAVHAGGGLVQHG